MSAIKVYSHALTTLDRVKLKLGITVTGFDLLLTSLINSVTDFIEHETNRHFLQGTYTEIKSVRGANQKFLYVSNPPIVTLTKLEYSAGMPTIKNWMEYPVTSYETEEDGSSGTIFVYSRIPQGTNKVRITYTGGYLFDWANVGDITKHELPLGVTELAENLIVKAFKRREKVGITSESFNGSNVVFKDEMDAYDKQTLSNYMFIRFV